MSRTAKVRSSYLCLDDFEKAAHRRLPPMLYTFIAEGAETNASLRGNRASFTHYALLPRVLRDVSSRSQEVTLFGQQYAHPFGIAPMGVMAVSAYRADLALGRAATDAGIPMIVSASSVVALEEIKRAAPRAWFQAYLPADPKRIEALVDRVAAAGYQTLVLTVDVPVPSNREHYVRSGFSVPLRPSGKLFWQVMNHPRWLFGTALRTLVHHGVPHFENLDATRGAPFLSQTAQRQLGQRDAFSWQDVALIRKRWKHNLVLKGILSPEDAALAHENGVDGIIVSNHGGRQLDCAVAPIHMLPKIREQSKDMVVMLDSGIRRGTDVLKALGLGADFVFLGRPFLYAAVAEGEAGARHAIALLAEEIDRDMALVGIRTISEMSPHQIVKAHS